MEPIPTIVITGGPCGGKTTALARLQRWLLECGYTPLVVPEATTLLISAGYSPTDADVQNEPFQKSVLQLQVATEASLRGAAARYSKSRKPILLFDRGLMDGSAYIDPTTFRYIAYSIGLSRESIFARYSAVVHLETAAINAEAFYTLTNNTARYEDGLEVARAVDMRTKAAWLGHPHLRIIENKLGKGFEEKMIRAKQVVAHALGIPEPREIERKFLVDRAQLPATIPVSHVTCDIEQTYIPSSNGPELRARRTRYDNSWMYTLTIKEAVSPGVRIERERTIGQSEYENLLATSGVQKRFIAKKRTSFLWNNQYFELDLFAAPHEALAVLEVELTDMQDIIVLPPFIPVVREVTDDDAYANARLAVLC